MEKLAHIEDWVAWSNAPSAAFRSANGQTTALSGQSLPPMLKRRLNAQGRACCEILNQLIPNADLPVIHASRHGDLQTSLTLLSDIVSDGHASPARFSLSVHNAVLGVYSIASGNQNSMQALAARGGEFDAAMEEAAGYLHDGHPAVVVLLSDDAAPVLLSGHLSQPRHACAVGLRLTLSSGQPLCRTAAPDVGNPGPIDVLEWLETPSAELPARALWTLGSL
ncbi:beta-ketoacyl synthase chain length factor [Halopseudomonas salegens]|uniref:Beta-ketoacyl synthase, N-terminal domain n=1 Tax=Halopseudomonas salegens TaxID=1434072 RepID=A0A1H2GWC4_9GAMM|nr:beta-ketoacyl synthase chain length factor [Halopseudomonas salegens]SDU23785.1 Beta-ketoacyl synthase, N-terminal domain [Halopseudomonas salegens]